jgi:serine/threonine protein kinase
MANFGPWNVVRVLGEGGQAHTYVVQRKDDPDQREYVLKRLKNLNRVERFEREIAVCSRFRHPNVLSVIEHGADAKGKPFLVTEYCSGGSLAEHPFPVGTPVLPVLERFRQICAGAAYAQGHDIVHCDIKPENIFLREDGTPVLGDFGICFVDDDGTRLTLTDEGAGSRFYCAPELRDGRLEEGVAATAADVYSLGKVLYWMLSGGQRFDREQHREEKYRIDAPDPLNPAYELVNQLFDAAIVHNWSKRIRDATKFLAMVDGVTSVVAAGGHALTLAARHRCMFCGRGVYRVAVDMTAPLPAGKTDQEVRNAQYSEARKHLGFNPFGDSTWIILVCDTCGHVVTFRPDRAPGATENWRRR